jgi:peptidyl-prolyl cis-trans isomerase A (cyclophilin A)
MLAALLAAGCSGNPCKVDEPLPLAAADSLLLEATRPQFQASPPDTFYVELVTSEGPLELEVITAWAPQGAARFYNLVRNGFYDGSRFFRVVPGFIAQFGTSGHPAIDAAWAEHPLLDDPPRVSNLQGTIAFAKSGPGTRVSQVFINYRDNPGLDQEGFAPFGRVVSGSGVLLRLYSLYGEPAPLGEGPPWQCVLEGGNAYLAERYGQLDYVETVRLSRP